MNWPPVVFPGTTEERNALVDAVGTNCSCERKPGGQMLVCGAHALLLDQRGLKYLIFYRRWRMVLWPGEQVFRARTSA